MKTKAITIVTALLFAFGSATFTGCQGGNEHQENMEHHEDADHHNKNSEHGEHAHYQCPMDCEDGKTYEEPGKCPVCNMDLKEVEK